MKNPKCEQWRHDLIESPRTSKIADTLKVSRFTAIGLLVCTLDWACCYLARGQDSTFPRQMLDLVIGYEGLADALIASGWLLSVGPGICFDRIGPWASKTGAGKACGRKR